MHVKQKLEVSERLACRVIGQPRYLDRKAERERPQMQRTILLSKGNPRYGYRTPAEFAAVGAMGRAE